MATCGKCRGADADPVDVVRDGAVVAAGALCAGCFEIAQAGADRLRLIFEGLCACGVSRAEANLRLFAIIDGYGAQA